MNVSILLLALSVTSCEAFVAKPLVYHASSSTTSTTTTTSLGMGILNRFRKRRKVEDQTKTIAIGSVLPDVDVERLVGGGEDGGDAKAEPISILEAVQTTDKALLIGMPGAFTPTCNQEHLPGYLSKAKAFRNLGVEKIGILTTNDSFVNEAWRQAQGVDKGSKEEDSTVVILSDGDADFCKSVGLAVDQGFGLGVRAGRFAMVVDSEGKVTNLIQEEDGGMNDCSKTSADSVLALLSPGGVVAEETEMDGVAVGVGIAIVVGLAAAFSGMGS